MEYNITKEKYLVSLFGYKLSKFLPAEWAILDKRDNNVGYVQCIERKDGTINYQTFLDENGIFYENSRIENNKSYYIKFYNGNDSTVNMELDGPKKSIDVLLNNSVFRLSWKTDDDNNGFTMESIKFIDDERGTYQEASSVDYIGSYPRRVFVNGREYLHDLETLINQEGNPQNMLLVLDMIFRHLPFEMSLEEIIGKEDIEKSGLKPVFEKVNEIKKGSRNK